MSTTVIQSLKVQVESTFGSIGASGVPVAPTFYTDAAGDLNLEFDRASVYEGQSTEFNERNEGRATPYDLPPEPVTMHASGVPLVRRTGEISLTIPWRTLGAATPNYINYSVTPIGKLMDTIFGPHTPGAGANFEAVTSGGSATAFDPTTFANFTDGALIRVEIGGRAEYSAVSKTAATTVTISPALSATLSGASIVENMETYYAAIGTTVGASVALEYDADGRRFNAYGCRVSSIRWYQANYRVMADITIACSCIIDDDASSSPLDPERLDGDKTHALGSYMVYAPASTTGIGTTNPAALARALFELADWEVTYTPTLAKRGRSDDLIGFAELEVTDFKVAGSLTFTPISAFASLALNQTQKSLMLGWGPVGEGNGGCIYIPAANFTTDGMPSEGEDSRQVMVMNFTAGNWTLDDSDTAPAKTNFRIGMPLEDDR